METDESYYPPADYDLSTIDHQRSKATRSLNGVSAASNRLMEYGEDLALLDKLDEVTLLNVVKSRFQQRFIHVSVVILMQL